MLSLPPGGTCACKLNQRNSQAREGNRLRSGNVVPYLLEISLFPAFVNQCGI